MAAGAEHDLGRAHALEVEAIGSPGERSFRIRVLSEGGSSSLWLEKEQVRALATAIQQTLAQHPRAGEERRLEAPPLGEFPRHPTHDFHVSRLALAYDDDAEALAIYVTDMEADEQEGATLRIVFDRHLARLFSAQAEATMTAGRPLCPLCKQPLEGSQHLCPPANGHSDDALAWLGPPDL